MVSRHCSKVTLYGIAVLLKGVAVWYRGTAQGVAAVLKESPGFPRSRRTAQGVAALLKVSPYSSGRSIVPVCAINM